MSPRRSTPRYVPAELPPREAPDLAFARDVTASILTALPLTVPEAEAIVFAALDRRAATRHVLAIVREWDERDGNPGRYTIERIARGMGSGDATVRAAVALLRDVGAVDVSDDGVALAVRK